MSRPLCIDLFCGLGGWTEGFLSEGYEVIGFDIERHIYGDHQYPAQLVLQDVRTLHGSQFKDATVIVASSPCQEFSYRAMPWKRAKALGPPVLGMELFAQAGRIQKEACAAAGRYIPMIQENVKGAQKYVGRAQWHYGSFYLWGDIPALMPIAQRAAKVPGMNWSGSDQPGYRAVAFNDSAVKNSGGSWFNVANNTTSGHGRNPARGDGLKTGGNWFGANKDHPLRQGSSGSQARKAASARIAKIPFPLAQWIARVSIERAA
jgi:hypothetical protein